ncbi:hypothetical protein HII36_39260 [Nonomuraea sp. NN258]|uniref:hypothetical protein n=1 Tax=Nonomuraea antri TaxID=2730852 RepID=UPI0015687B6C|nr:hypothetical protein [Nonomuraea antri]NRQ37826.1 hypothetical protein [Nonomuraea antri]
MRHLTRAAAALALSTAGAALTVVPSAQADLQRNGCRYFFTSLFPSPAGDSTGMATYAEGDHDPEGRVCEDGWWVTPYADAPDAALG